MYGFHGKDGSPWRGEDDWGKLTTVERKALLTMIKQHTSKEKHTVGGTDVRVREITHEDVQALAIRLSVLPETVVLGSFNPAETLETCLATVCGWLEGPKASWLQRPLADVVGSLQSCLLVVQADGAPVDVALHPGATGAIFGEVRSLTGLDAEAAGDLCSAWLAAKAPGPQEKVRQLVAQNAKAAWSLVLQAGLARARAAAAKAALRPPPAPERLPTGSGGVPNGQNAGDEALIRQIALAAGVDAKIAKQMVAEIMERAKKNSPEAVARRKELEKLDEAEANRGFVTNAYRRKGNETINPTCLKKWQQGRQQQLRLEQMASDNPTFGKSSEYKNLLARAKKQMVYADIEAREGVGGGRRWQRGARC